MTSEVCEVRAQIPGTDHKLERERVLTRLSPLSEKLLALVRDHGKLTVRDAATLTGASRNTIKDHLRRLVDAGRLNRRGKGRGTWYGTASAED